jgi:type 1 fimbria pilin
MEESMKPTVLALTAFMLVGVGAYAAPKSANRTFNGEIMDSACANMGNHDAGYKMSNTHTPKDCTLECVKSGSKFVLYNSAAKTAYQLDDQQKPREFAGQKVKVIGTYDTGSKTIHVEKIEAGS